MTQKNEVLRLISKSVPWPSDQQQRPASALKWDVYLGEEEIVSGSKRPFEDATATLHRRGVDPETLVTMRHDNSPHDSFVPVKLEIAAKPGLKRFEGGQRLREYFEAKKAEEGKNFEP